MLHVTNGTSVSLRESGLGGEVLAWIDVLHEGPVPAGLGPEELRYLRELYLDAEAGLTLRDAALQDISQHEEVALWFEHDLFDQLQLIQILDRLRPHAGGPTRLSLICIDQYLGTLTGPQLANYWPARHTITREEFDLAAAAWRAFRSADPMDIEELLRDDTSALPFLDGALRRHLEQFPSIENGLARTEQQILELVQQGKRNSPALFVASQSLEERVFMGDGTFQGYLRALSGCRRRLLSEQDGKYYMTEVGQDVLRLRADHVRLNGINRWLGGVHLDGGEVLWRWDSRNRRLVRY